ncbi:hypothetical protein NDU88_001920 [Pleurodeles waltl]|uniref:Uncharacterized protein n=1 Tax=Pleurodeles waltl TaxID=8319 RepID=A0AAV7WJS2_PLEWA|nr:hypothetical protein NDU88_001920 [Pleurodeles waltl]
MWPSGHLSLPMLLCGIHHVPPSRGKATEIQLPPWALRKTPATGHTVVLRCRPLCTGLASGHQGVILAPSSSLLQICATSRAARPRLPSRDRYMASFLAAARDPHFSVPPGGGYQDPSPPSTGAHGPWARAPRSPQATGHPDWVQPSTHKAGLKDVSGSFSVALRVMNEATG